MQLRARPLSSSPVQPVKKKGKLEKGSSKKNAATKGEESEIEVKESPSCIPASVLKAEKNAVATKGGKSGIEVKGSPSCIPVSVLKALKAKDHGELFEVEADFRKDSHILNAWWNGMPQDADPMVLAMSAPGIVMGTTLCPPLPQLGPILMECGAVILQYSNFNAAALGGPGFPALVPIALAALPAGPIFVHKGPIALSKLMEHIQTLTAPAFPAIGALGSGCYICTIVQNWANGVVSIRLHKA